MDEVTLVPNPVGIIGGMGPYSTLKFYEHVLAIAVANYGATADHTFPEISIKSIGIPELTPHGLTEMDVSQKRLEESAKELESLGAECIAIPCNTVHIFYTDIQNAVSIPVLHMIEETASAVNAGGYEKAYVLGTQTTVDGGAYTTALSKFGVQALYPSEEVQLTVEDLISALELGEVTAEAQTLFLACIADAVGIGADCIVLGCTELSMLDAAEEYDFPCIDSSYELAKSLLSFSYATSTTATL